MTVYNSDSAVNTSQDYNQALAYISALTQIDANVSVVDIRLLHDTNKGVKGHAVRGTLPNLWPTILQHQNQGYGCFININDMDGNGLLIENVRACRVAAIDLDNASAQQNFERACAWTPAPPQFGVNTSPGKYHCYWIVPPFNDLDCYTQRQRRLRQMFDGDKSIIDASRVLRLPGTLHLKNQSAPHLVTCFQLSGYGQVTQHDALDGALAHINVIDGGHSERKPLGDPSLAAPSIEWLQRALDLTDPNNLDRGEWVSFMAGVKQSGWSLTDDTTLYGIFTAWCERYELNDPAENLKQWASVRNTEIGWPNIGRRVPQMQLEKHSQAVTIPAVAATVVSRPEDVIAPPPPLDCKGELLTAVEQQTWFKGCVLIGPESRIIDSKGILYNQSAFNASFGGKRFIVTQDGKTTDEPWKAATRGTQSPVPKVDGMTFLTGVPTGHIITDELGRDYVNTYVPARIDSEAGDVQPFLAHLSFMFPNADDQRILIEYMAHNAKYPGHKIPWAPVIQSTEGVGKNLIKYVMMHVMGDAYTYPVNSKELGESGGKFNGWMKNKLFLIADEIKVPKRDIVDDLKDMISEKSLEMQDKGVNQNKYANVSNWLFFSNHQDAIPIGRNSRRFAVFYSAFQSADDIARYGLDDSYFNTLFDDYLGVGEANPHKRGLRFIADYLLTHPIERGAIPMRAPTTSTMTEAIAVNRTPLQSFVLDCVEEGRSGFKGGWVNTAALANLWQRAGHKAVEPAAMGSEIRELKYHFIGRAGSAWFEDISTKRGNLWNTDPAANARNYGSDQGYIKS